MEKTKEKLWTKEFITLSLINFLATIVFFLLMVTIAKYAVSEFDVSTSTAGLASSIFIIGSLFGRLGGGQFISKLGSKKTLFYGLIGFVITTLLYFAAFNVGLLLVYRLLQGVAVGLVGTATGTIIAQILPANRRGEGIGYFSLSAILATAVGPYIGIFLLQNFDGFNTIFIFNAILAVIVFVMFFMVKFPESLMKPLKATGKTTVEKTGGVFSKLIEKRAVPISLVALFVGLAYSGVLSFMTFYTTEINLEKVGGNFFLIYAAVVILTRPVTGKL
ncbi:MFS transporter, partial [Bacillus sp. JJ634]